jgi:hypothetical protein
MRIKFNGRACMAVTLLATLGFAATVEFLSSSVSAQTLVTAQLSGVVTDSSGAVVQNAEVTIVDTSTGTTRVLTTNVEGRYVSPFMEPHAIIVSASAPGLQSDATSVQLLVGQQSVVNLAVSPAGNKETVTVSGNDAQLIDTQTANLVTTFTTDQFQNLPMPGMDLTTIAYTAPGVQAAPGGGVGNFVSNGIPGNSNLFVIDGADFMDFTTMTNNSGSSSLVLGASEIAQASVVQNGYSVQYGQAAGLIATYTTKSGTNKFHGMSQYNYNSDGFDANDFFSKLAGLPRSKAISDQYAAQLGGPIWKNKLFGFVDYEGLRIVMGSTAFINYPTAQLQNTILNTVSAQSASLYSTMFDQLSANPTYYSTAQPVTNGSGPLQDASNTLGCGSLAGTPVHGQPNTYFGTAPAGGTAVPCVNAALAEISVPDDEWRLAFRVDYDINEKQSVFFRYSDESSVVQIPNLIDPSLDGRSPQAPHTGQLNHTYVFSPNLTNNFIAAFSKSESYRYPVLSDSQILAISPTMLSEPNDAGTNSQAGFGVGGNIGFLYNNLPGGPNQSEYQATDDLSWLKGNHNFKLGLNFLRTHITQSGAVEGTLAPIYNFGDAADFANGTLPGGAGSNLTQSFAEAGVPREANYNLGIYAQDEWKATHHLVLDLGLRVDRYGNPLCTTHCYTFYNGGFPASGATLDTPYNATLTAGKSNMFPSVQIAAFEPRAGFNWDMTGQGKTVVRGGVGLFSTLLGSNSFLPTFINFPSFYTPQVLSGVVGLGQGSAAAAAVAANNVITAGYSQGMNINQMATTLPAGVPFTPPAFFVAPQKFVNPSFLEWSLQAQRGLTPYDAVIVSYAGNHGEHLQLGNQHLNQSLGASPYIPASQYTSFGGLPAASPDPRFGEVSSFVNGAISNYNGVSLVYKHVSRGGITTTSSYTWSHSLDDSSNNGVYNYQISSQIEPNRISALDYSNSAYDARNNFVMDVTYIEPNHFANRLVQLGAGGWTVAGKAFWRSGSPFSVINTNAQNALNNGTGANNVLADVLTNNYGHVCKSFSHPCLQAPGIFNGSASQDDFGNVPRNSFYGPHYADVDLSAFKDLVRAEKVQFQIGAQAYNALNHVNFGTPQNNASNPATLGKFNDDISPPTGPYGGFTGAQGRTVVLQGRLIF